MSLPPLDRDLEHVSARQGSTGTVCDLADISASHHVKAEYSIGFGIIECTLFDHERRAALFACGRPFFGRLKDEFNGSLQLTLERSQNLCDTHQNGDVVIVTTRMH